MKYLLLIYFDETWQKLSLAERQRIYQGQMDVATELTAKGQYLGGNPLEPAETATSVRVRDGKRLLIDGPFAETREQLGGYYLVEAADLDEAIKLAARIPSSKHGSARSGSVAAPSSPAPMRWCRTSPPRMQHVGGGETLSTISSPSGHL